LYLIVACTKKNEKLTNVALKKKTFQSSTYGGRRRKYYSSAQAVDGLSKTFVLKAPFIIEINIAVKTDTNMN
jgi:hypothetical protein